MPSPYDAADNSCMAIFHLKWPRMKHEENSNRGDREAARRGFDGIDHDWQKDADGVVWNTHWQDVFRRDGFHDPERKVGRGDRFRRLHARAIRRLRAVTRGHTFRIRTADEGIRHAAKVGLKVVYGEAKPGNVWTIEDFAARKRVADAAGIRLVVMTMDNWPGWQRTLLAARAAGCVTRRIRMH
jgi:hypothetical protein